MPGVIHSVSDFERVEVVTGVERRRRWSLGEKLKAVEEWPYRASILGGGDGTTTFMAQHDPQRGMQMSHGILHEAGHGFRDVLP